MGDDIPAKAIESLDLPTGFGREISPSLSRFIRLFVSSINSYIEAISSGSSLTSFIVLFLVD